MSVHGAFNLHVSKILGLDMVILGRTPHLSKCSAFKLHTWASTKTEIFSIQKEPLRNQV